MPEPWIYRTMEGHLRDARGGLALFPVWLLLGPRQVGKSSLLRHLGEGRMRVDLDDLQTRLRANADPVLFARDLRTPLIVDEIQYAPGLLPALKVLADARPGPGAVWITGSQSFEVMRGVTESLAGRVAILHLQGLSGEEGPAPTTPSDTFEALVRSRFPALASVEDPEARDLYLNSYLQTYIERDVRELLGIQKRREFERFVRLCALRTGQIVNQDDLGRDAGVSPATVRDWLSVLADSFLLTLIPPWHSNRSSRLIKSPKLYFLDAGLAAHLAGWRTAAQVRDGAQSGALFETWLLGNLLSAFHHRARIPRIHFWRDRDGREIDFLVETHRGIVPVEGKVGRPGSLPPLARIREEGWQEGRVASLSAVPGNPVRISPEWTLLSPGDLVEELVGGG